MADKKCDLSFWVFLKALGGEVKKIKRMKLSPFERGFIGGFLSVIAGALALIALPTPVNVLGALFIVFGFLWIGYGMWREDKEDC